ncbi:5476_t:CDS:2 [Scutellospora calospora]|uniref:5476_t:CDS:1 n=1 Tax=Scutellospora calospora TaxID=85575 RepID=A0ACA9JU63_9GLOM|nr:5476_t:CDS:2 [Scutellospora calospora]
MTQIQKQQDKNRLTLFKNQIILIRNLSHNIYAEDFSEFGVYEGISNIPPKPEREKDFSSTLKTYLTKKKNRSQRDQTASREVRASAVEAFTINGLKEEIRQREVTLEALNKRIKGIESERDRAQIELDEAQAQLK